MKDKLYVVAIKNDVQSEDDIFVTRATDKEDALYNYARDYWSKHIYFLENIEDRAINGTFWEIFLTEIFELNMPEGYTTNLTDNEVDSQFKELIKIYLEEYDQYVDTLFDFYNDESKTVKDLDDELLTIIAWKGVSKDRRFYVIKEINV
ncbi:MAG: hypothetical protein ABS939_17445 [Psychrobacillus sp.]